MNKVAFLQGYMNKTAVWTGYTAETGATTASDKRENGEEFGEGEQILNDGRPPKLKDYEGGGMADIAGLPKGANLTTDQSMFSKTDPALANVAGGTGKPALQPAVSKTDPSNPTGLNALSNPKLPSQTVQWKNPMNPTGKNPFDTSSAGGANAK
jgi:hypothetical protein